MEKLLFYLLTLSICIGACKTKAPIKESNRQKSDFFFPIDWVGVYQGELKVYDAIGQQSKIAMKLTIQQPDATGMYPWIVQYGEKDLRYYGLEAIDATKGHYAIDEYNSIKLDAYLRGNNFISAFEVQGNTLLFQYTKTAIGIDIQVSINKVEPQSESGGEIIGKNKIPIVKSFELKSFQKATLLKIE